MAPSPMLSWTIQGRRYLKYQNRGQGQRGQEREEMERAIDGTSGSARTSKTIGCQQKNVEKTAPA